MEIVDFLICIKLSWSLFMDWLIQMLILFNLELYLENVHIVLEVRFIHTPAQGKLNAVFVLPAASLWGVLIGEVCCITWEVVIFKGPLIMLWSLSTVHVKPPLGLF